MLWYFLKHSFPPPTSTKHWSRSTKLTLLSIDGLRPTIWKAWIYSIISSAACAEAQARVMSCYKDGMTPPPVLFPPLCVHRGLWVKNYLRLPWKVLIYAKKAFWNLDSRHLIEFGESTSEGRFARNTGSRSYSDETWPLIFFSYRGHPKVHTNLF